jgi:pyruvate formate lyase activating enzyme
MHGRVHSIETLGGADGPGVRCVVFLQGCLLRCGYCHNPDTWDPAGGTTWRADAVVAEVERCRPYFGRRGGVTVSGGEPLLQAAFTREILARCKDAGIHTALDTSGCVFNQTVERVLTVTDLVLLDIKSSDPEDHKALTGTPLEPVLRFLEELDSRGIETWVRHVVVPGRNDSPGHIRDLTKRIIGHSCVRRVDLLGYHDMAEEKWRALGREYPLAGTPPLAEHTLRSLASLMHESLPDIEVQPAPE